MLPRRTYKVFSETEIDHIVALLKTLTSPVVVKRGP
jgi:hypothetical protein